MDSQKEEVNRLEEQLAKARAQLQQERVREEGEKLRFNKINSPWVQ